MTCPSPKGEGILLVSILREGLVDFQSNVLFEDEFGFSPVGETGEGFCFCPRGGGGEVVISLKSPTMI